MEASVIFPRASSRPRRCDENFCEGRFCDASLSIFTPTKMRWKLLQWKLLRCFPEHLHDQEDSFKIALMLPWSSARYFHVLIWVMIRFVVEYEFLKTTMLLCCTLASFTWRAHMHECAQTYACTHINALRSSIYIHVRVYLSSGTCTLSW